MIKAKIVGAGGYGGVGILELLMRHPEVEPAALVDVVDAGRPISDLYPHLAGYCDLEICTPDSDRACETYDVVFFSTPDGVGMQAAAGELERGAKVIDYSGDFRFGSAESYADYANFIGREPEHASPDLLEEAVYGVPEFHRDAIAGARLVGNPGCFAISALLGLVPAVGAKLAAPGTLIADGKTGVSGAGKKASPVFHYPARYEQMNAYKLGGHQHLVEVEHELSARAGRRIALTFTTQVVPVCRGIMTSLYGTLEEGVDYARALAAYRDFYADAPFVRVCDRSVPAGTHHVRGSNRALLLIDVDERTGRLRVISHIDNLMKGQAGNALQNMNLMFGLDETAGLTEPGRYP
ncbi:N-acetyl-gamma-glutamyl-phosphate reductase [Kiritimatiella glycovorans]|uniref:N-acetyl-gamma-glutamyl-phosphate reductase n=1 Tax=Kiritimatiella glycovorans TaxID=1307763 RepID=A0A0G3EGS1_9BACT|nr:N-acetyl-gamma-glutamyl-phosphate reductase [Kiritimatiella glycovorans]AKJ63319.1 N-acetyl-gamma-glutamyl-phosphate reductase [Kiritimatiella glycovorans]